MTNGITTGEAVLLGLTALFLCFLFLFQNQMEGNVVRLVPSGGEAGSGTVQTAGAAADVSADAADAAGAPTAEGSPVAEGSPAVEGSPPAQAAEPSATGIPALAGDPRAPTESLIDLNTAGEAELTALPGIGPVLAARIVAWREEHGPFPSVEAVTEVSGIGPAKLAAIAPLVTVSGGGGA